MSSSPTAARDRRPLVAFITGHLAPYRIHLHTRIATELTEARLATVVTKYRTGPWVNPNLPEIGCVMLDTEQPPEGGRKGLGLLLHELGTARRTVRWLEEQRPAAVVCGGYDEIPNIRAIVWASRRGVPAFVWADSNAKGDLARGWKRAVKRAYVPRIMRKCYGAIVFGRLGRAFFGNYGVPEARTWLAPLEPDYAMIEGMSAARVASIVGELGLAQGRRRLVCCCRLIEAKRVDMVIDAFAAIAAERPEWDLIIAGEGHLRAELEERARCVPGGRVRFLGFLDQERVTGVYRASDVLVLASEYEPWALVVNEAAAAGCAIVASDVVGAAPELVRDGVNGYLFASGDVRALTERLRAATAPDAIDRLKSGSPGVVAEWRREADPVRGMRAALRACGAIA